MGVKPGNIPWNKGKKCPNIGFEYGNIPWNKGKKGLQVGWNKGKKMPESMSIKITGSCNSQWKGDDVKRTALHNWVRRHWPGGRPSFCQICNKRPSYDLINISKKMNIKTYNRDFKNWRWSCRGCHMHYDGRIYNLYQFQSCGELVADFKNQQKS